MIGTGVLAVAAIAKWTPALVLVTQKQTLLNAVCHQSKEGYVNAGLAHEENLPRHYRVLLNQPD
jgi:hypothetical protein